MTTENNQKKTKKKLTKIVGMGLAGALTIVGTLSNSTGCAPVYVNKHGTSYGICVGASVKLEEGSKFYGVVVSGLNQNNGEIYGINLSGMSINNRKISGAEIGILNIHAENSSVSGLELGLSNGGAGLAPSGRLDGIAIGFIQGHSDGNLIQLGIYNAVKTPNGERKSFGVNYAFDGSSNIEGERQ